MANPVAVAVVDGLDDLSEYLPSLGLFEVLPVDYAVEQFSARADSGQMRLLENKVNVFAIFKGVVEP